MVFHFTLLKHIKAVMKYQLHSLVTWNFPHLKNINLHPTVGDAMQVYGKAPLVSYLYMLYHSIN